MAIRETLEREVKRRAASEFKLPELGGEPIKPRLFVSTYHDTADHRLGRRGITLRHRVENGKELWQLKLLRGNARLELEADGGPGSPPTTCWNCSSLSFVAPLVPTRAAPYSPRRRPGRRRRRSSTTRSPSSTTSVSPAASRSSKVELLDGSEKTLRRIEKELRRAGATDGETRPKVFQALDLDFRAEPVGEPDDESSAATLRARIREQVELVLAHDPGTRLGTESEELHQMRVATRRLRAFQRAGSELLDPKWSESVREELKWLGGALGTVRDLDVLVEHLTREVESLGSDQVHGRKLLRSLERSRRTARRKLVALLDSDRYFALLDTLEQPVATIADTPTLEEIHAAEHKRLKKAVKT
jgi:hypothetical protein